jgi:hypothetical protein
MGQLYTGTFSAVAPGASVTKGLLAVTTGSTQPAIITALDISMDGSTSTTFWPLFEVLIFSGSYTAPTGGTSITLNKGNGEAQNKAAISTAKKGTFSAEAAVNTGAVFTAKSKYLPSGSVLPYQWPLGREGLYVPESCLLYVRATTPASFAQNIAIDAEVEE